MANPRLEDHATGVEMELVELVERRERARVQGLLAEVVELDRQIDALHLDLARTAERIAVWD